MKTLHAGVKKSNIICMCDTNVLPLHSKYPLI